MKGSQHDDLTMRDSFCSFNLFQPNLGFDLGFAMTMKSFSRRPATNLWLPSAVLSFVKTRSVPIPGRSQWPFWSGSAKALLARGLGGMFVTGFFVQGTNHTLDIDTGIASNRTGS